MSICVVFFHGFMKDGTDWNITNRNVNINIENTIKESYNTINITFDNDLYLLPFNNACIKLREVYKLYDKNLVIVGHSIGGLYALMYSYMFSKDIKGLILVDSTLPTESYYIRLKKLYLEETNVIKKNIRCVWIQNYNTLPKITDIQYHIIIYSHINVTNNENSVEKIEQHNMLISSNSKSKLIKHINSSHMIHYKEPDRIIRSIKTLLSLI